jgi:hypothetical protein
MLAYLTNNYATPEMLCKNTQKTTKFPLFKANYSCIKPLISVLHKINFTAFSFSTSGEAPKFPVSKHINKL